MKSTIHPFYCSAKGCRKTALDTPEYLTPADWLMVDGVIPALEAGDQVAFDAALRAGDERAFFNRVIGWPEGISYYLGGSEAGRKFQFGGIRGQVAALKTARARQFGELFAAV